ncbi:Protein of unknown function [Nocardioides alpinus]|uniref:DUF3618 domain-containing protein n=1 Tax=Nocardioides alpinus TaxID=748909 RepID=A0A1I0XUS1_9ACTN|nr:DUF3618 domain-containing protein [Nocardioides alpinus]PKH42845.1 DUF3618 domain-containing protein [Nocardioides alpinus]SFB04674.1 Protein of unknown function [Nocardioides alpinus]
MSDARTPEQIEAEIVLQREQLAGTVDELAAKLDVKSRAQDKVAELKSSATTESGAPRPEVLAAAGSLAAMAVVLLLWRHRRTH